MTPEERQLLVELFDRVRSQQGSPRDREAEAFIADAVRAQPSAPYLLAQSVIVQDHALRAADDRIQALEVQVRDLQSAPPNAPAEGGGSFLGGIGRSLFGSGPAAAAPPPQHAPAPPNGPWGNQTSYAPASPQPQWSAPPQAQWSPPPQAPAGGGSFLHGALGAAAGVAGGVLLADSIRGLFGAHNNPLGIGSGLGGGSTGLLGGGLGQTGLEQNGLGQAGLGQTGHGDETIINNYYDNPGDAGSQSLDSTRFDDSQNIDADFQDSSGDWSNSDDGTTDV